MTTLSSKADHLTSSGKVTTVNTTDNTSNGLLRQQLVTQNVIFCGIVSL